VFVNKVILCNLDKNKNFPSKSSWDSKN